VGGKRTSNRPRVQGNDLDLGLNVGFLPLLSDPEMKRKAKPGPITLSDAQLITRRNSWSFLLENYWGAIGWELKCARSHEAIHEAFRSLASKSSEQMLQPFLRDRIENSDSKTLGTTEKAYSAAALKQAEIETKLNEQRNRVQEAQSAVSELSGRNRKQLKEQIVWRNENVREIAIRLSTKRAEVRKLERVLKKAVDRNRESCTAQLDSVAVECQKIEKELDTEKRIVQDLEAGLGTITAIRRQAAAKILRERKTALVAIEREELDARAASAKLRERLLDQQAYFCRAELQEFIRPKKRTRKKYAHTARNLANALAGLPVMTCGQSAKRCGKFPYNIAPGWAGQLFDLLDRTWRYANSKRRESPLSLFKEAIAKIPKTQIIRVDGKGRKIENDFRRYLEKNWANLKSAIEDGVRTSTHPNEVPYRIAAKFQENWSKPKTHADILLAQQERLSV
jgi:hypothetical protein